MTDTLRATRPDHADTTGIYVRAVGLNGRWGSHDIAELDAPSLLAWLRSHDGMAENAVGMSHIRFHDLRHTYASWLVQGGAGLAAVRDLLGHSSLAVTSRYSHLARPDLVAATSKLKI